MSTNQINDVLRELISKDLDANIAHEEIENDTPLFEDGLGLDSILLVELISLVEKKFDIKFSDEELIPEYFSTVGNLADTISGKQK